MKDMQKTKRKPVSTERRRGTQEQMAKMVAERTEMLAVYCRLAGLDPFQDARHRRPAQKLLQEFCQILVDYIAAGHFSLYERLSEGRERRRELVRLADELFPRVAETTQIALDFNDKYDCGDHCEITMSFESDLSHLGEELAVRIELEDKLISRLLS